MEESEEDWGDGEEDDLPVPVPDARQAQGQQRDEEEDGVEGREGTHLGGGAVWVSVTSSLHIILAALTPVTET